MLAITQLQQIQEFSKGKPGGKSRAHAHKGRIVGVEPLVRGTKSHKAERLFDFNTQSILKLSHSREVYQ